MSCRHLARVILACSSLLLPAAAQTGPWVDGDLIIHTGIDGGFGSALRRINPDTGAGATLVPYLGIAGGGNTGRVAFDPYRGGLLASFNMQPDPYWLGKLWLIDSNGAATSLGFAQEDLAALAPVGDGRVYFQRRANNPGQKIEWLDASNVAHVLMQPDGVTPVSAWVEQMVYWPAGNALLATVSSQYGCGAGVSVRKLPLSADGTRLAGPVTCATGGSQYALLAKGIDVLPGGNFLVTTDNGSYFWDQLLVLNPWTMTLGTWAKAFVVDIDGGCWSARRGQAVIVDDGGNQLLGFDAGDDGTGDPIPTNVSVSNFTSGHGLGETVYEIKLLPAGCAGLLLPYGAGLAGKDGFVPALGGAGCPDIGQGWALTVDRVVGGASGVLFAGLSQAALPFKGGTFLVGSVVLQLPIAVGGTPGQANAGFLSLPAALVDPVLVGLDLYLQAGFSDAGAVKGVSLSNGLRVQAG